MYSHLSLNQKSLSTFRLTLSMSVWRFRDDVIDHYHTVLLPETPSQSFKIMSATSSLSRVIHRDVHTKSILVAGNHQKKVFFGGE